MNRVAKAATQPPGEMPADLLKTIHWGLFALFLAAATWAGIAAIAPGAAGKPGAAEAVLVLSTASLTLVSLSRRLPGQNVLLASGIIAILGSLAHAAGAWTGIPFGRFGYTTSAGPVFSDMFAWFMPFLWVIIILNSRGVARLILRPWRRTRRYGFWVLGLTTVLTVLLTFGLEPFATRIKGFWLWAPSKIPFDWYGVPVSNFVGWIAATLIILGFATPSLMSKRPSGSSPDYSPLAVWVLLNGVFILGAASRQFWLAVGFSAVAIVVVTALAIRGARW